MRLICPNCGAQYEVPDDVIPDAGRDVQCSNCGHTWFERPGDSVTAEEGVSTVEMAEPDLDSEPQETVAAPEDAPEDESGEWQGFGDLPAVTPRRARPAAAAPAPDESDEDPEPAASPVARRGSGLDPDVADILRQEAAREEAVRRAEAETLPAAAAPEPVIERQRRQESERRLARMRGDEAEEPAPAAKAAERRERLPDVEEINSTLRATEERGDAAEPSAVRRPPNGFRRGFALAVLLATILMALYVMAPDLSLRFPAAKPALDTYADLVDSLRLGLERLMQMLIDKIGGAVEPTTGTT